ncbi:MAG: DNA translocase FtsK, partial [Acidimicrobiales bacterium]
GGYASLGGAAGRVAADTFDDAFGLLALGAPPALAAVGVLVLRRRGGEAAAARPLLGAGLAFLSAEALLHVGWRAGGGLGRLLAEPSSELLGAGGAGAAAALGLVVALLVVTRTTVRDAATLAGRAWAPVWALVVRAVQSLFRVEEGGEGEGQRTAPMRSGPAEAEGGGRPRSSRAEEATERIAPVPSPPPSPSLSPSPARPPADDPAEADPPAEAEQLQLALERLPMGDWRLPEAEALHRAGAQQVDRAAVEETGRRLEAALAEHGVETRLVGMVVGPTVSRYELELAPGVKVARVTSLHRDIAYAMATPDVRILAPIPGRQAIGVEVPNTRRQLVALGDILASEEAQRAVHPLEVGIGRDIAGRSVMLNLATMPHILIAGATGAGKSSCINSLITSILMRSTPDQVRMILVDPKRVELGQYNKLPHLLTQVVTNPKKAANALAWAVKEMERRYDLLSEVGVRDITGYNEAYDRGDLTGEESDVLRAAFGPGEEAQFPRLPFIVIVVDELNDLMMVAARDVEDSICRIAQMARAVGIHLVIATQRPSVNVITGVIKANIPARLAFAVSSLADSRVILDQPGAERLVGKGDLLLLSPSSSSSQRIQGCWVTEGEVRAVVAHWRRQAPQVEYLPGVEGEDPGHGGGAGAAGVGGEGDDDDLLAQAKELIVRSQLGSTSMLQRKLRVGFARAGRLMDLLEQQGVVGPSTGSKAREVLMTPDELDAPAGSHRLDDAESGYGGPDDGAPDNGERADGA